MRSSIIVFLITFIFCLNAQTQFYAKFPFVKSNGVTRNAIKTHDGGYVLLREDQIPGESSYKTILIKTDINGVLQWVSSTYLHNALFPPDGVWCAQVKETSDHGFYVVGKASLSGEAKLLILKLDSMGNLIWNKSIDDPAGSEQGISVITTNDGGCVLLGGITYTNNSTAICAARTNSLGIIAWYKKFEVLGKNISGGSITNTIDGGFFISGSMSGPAALAIKIDANFNVSWAGSYGSAAGYGVGSQTSEGGYIIISTTPNSNAHLFKIRSDGTLKWNKSYVTGGSSANYGNTISETYDKGYIAGGFTTGFAPANFNGAFFKTDSLGNIDFFKTTPDSSDVHWIEYDNTGFIISTCKFDQTNKSYPELFKTDRFGNIPCGLTNQTVTVTTPTVSASTENITEVSNPTYTTGAYLLTNTVAVYNAGSPECSDVGVNENTNKNFKLYPNPVHDIVQIDLEESTSELKIKIIDLYGALISKHVLFSSQKSLNVSHLTPGVYFIELDHNGVRSKQKLLKTE